MRSSSSRPPGGTRAHGLGRRVFPSPADLVGRERIRGLFDLYRATGAKGQIPCASSQLLQRRRRRELAAPCLAAMRTAACPSCRTPVPSLESPRPVQGDAHPHRLLGARQHGRKGALQRDRAEDSTPSAGEGSREWRTGNCHLDPAVSGSLLAERSMEYRRHRTVHRSRTRSCWRSRRRRPRPGSSPPLHATCHAWHYDAAARSASCRRGGDHDLGGDHFLGEPQRRPHRAVKVSVRHASSRHVSEKRDLDHRRRKQLQHGSVGKGAVVPPSGSTDSWIPIRAGCAGSGAVSPASRGLWSRRRRGARGASASNASSATDLAPLPVTNSPIWRHRWRAGARGGALPRTPRTSSVHVQPSVGPSGAVLLDLGAQSG